MAKFLLLIVDDPSVASIDEAEMKALIDDYWAYDDALAEIGALVDCAPLVEASRATTVAPSGVTTDGPFAESSEAIGGYYVIEVPDHATAVDWARKCPGVVRGHSRVEVRPILEMTR